MKIKNYKKYHKNNKIFKNEKITLATLKKGFYGFKVLQSGIITPKQIEVIRRVVARITKRIGKTFINVSCTQSLTKKPLLSRMGKGVGSIDSWISYVKKGKILLEIKGVSRKVALKAFKVAQSKICLKIDFIEREIIDA